MEVADAEKNVPKFNQINPAHISRNYWSAIHRIYLGQIPAYSMWELFLGNSAAGLCPIRVLPPYKLTHYPRFTAARKRKLEN
jgi:hypothetical protein